MDVGTRIKAYLDSRGISQTFLSRKSGVPLVKLNLVLNGKRKLTLSEYQTICWALDVGVDTFLEARPPMTEEAANVN